MYGIDILIEEHENIKRMANVMRTASLQVMNGGELLIADFDQMVDFVRNYADKHHHQKEENILFVSMKQELGKIAENLITHGMLVEHDLGRLHMMELYAALRSYETTKSDEAKLDVIVNTTAYTYLIKRHIDKENAVAFTYGEKNLSYESKCLVDAKTKEMEDNSTACGTSDKYLKILDQLETKYVS